MMCWVLIRGRMICVVASHDVLGINLLACRMMCVVACHDVLGINLRACDRSPDNCPKPRSLSLASSLDSYTVDNYKETRSQFMIIYS